MANKMIAGIHPGDSKFLSEKSQIKTMPASKTVYISLSQHIGRDATPVVTAGDKVKVGQLIGKADGSISSNIFSSVSGIVKEIAERKTSTGYKNHIIIENDGKGEEIKLPSLSNPDSEQITDRLAECGIVGMGGAGFPTAVKLKPQEKIDTFIINAAECEPYITCDYRIMLDYTMQFMLGSALLAKAVNLDKFIIAIEDNKPDAIRILNTYISINKVNAEIVVLKTRYPQGSEKQLIHVVTGRKVPSGKLPSAVGVLVNNVHTALSAYLAIVDGQPLTKRVMTVSGLGIKNPSNLWVPVGTLFSDIIEFTGGLSQTVTVKLINGGPMMGIAVDNEDISTTKTTSSLLLLTEEEAFTGSPMPCINCGKCARACPMKLMPMFIDAYALAGDTKAAVKYGARNCIECGCCAYTCPAKRPIVQSIRLAKKRDSLRGAK